MSDPEVYLTRDEIERPYANLAVMIEDKRRKAKEMKKTIFDQITASPEVLAPEFVGMMYNRVWGDYLNYSMLTGEWYETHAEAIAATVAKLKEVCDE